MADRYLLESGAPDGYLLEDGTGVYLLEAGQGPFQNLNSVNTPEPRRQSGVMTVTQSLLLTTLAVVASTDQVRAPLYAKNQPKPQAVASAFPNLLTSTLSGGVVTPQPQPGPASVATPAYRWFNDDTSQGSPLTLVAVVVQPKPQPQPSQVTLPRYQWQNGDTSQTSIRFRGLDPIASAMPETLAPQRFPHSITDTSFRNFAALNVTPPPPVVPTVYLSVNLRNVNADTSKSTGRTLLDVVAPPFVNPPQYTPDRIRTVSDTSTALAKSLYGDATIPVQNLQHTPPDRVRAVTDTSQGKNLALQDAPVPPPLVNAPQYQVDRLRPVADTSAGTAKTLTQDAQPPVFNAPQFRVYQQPPVTDTSEGLNLALANFIPPPPFVQSDWPAPVEFKRFYEPSQNSTQPPDTIPPQPPAPTVVIDTHDGGRKKKHKRESELVEEKRLAGERLRAQLTALVDPKPLTEVIEEAAEQAISVFKETPKPVILPALPVEDDDEEDILKLLMSYYEIPRRILP